MARLDIRFADGTEEQRELTREAPLLVGTSSSNDLVLEDEGVGRMHCRIAWTKGGYEVTSAVLDGIELNRKLVQRAVLRSGDTIRVGRTEIRFLLSPGEPVPVEAPSGPKLRPVAAAEPVETMSASWDDDADADPDVGPMISRHPSQAAAVDSRPASLPSGRMSTVPGLLGQRPRRPGEQDPLRSPLVLGLGGGVLALALTAATLYFVIGRTSTQLEYDRAAAQMEQRNFAAAITAFDEFVRRHPQHKLTDAAQLNRDVCRVQQSVTSASPVWPKALEALQELLRRHQDKEGFGNVAPNVRGIAYEIAVGAAASAGRTHEPSLLKVTETARQLVQFHGEKGAALDEMLRQIDKTAAEAERQILQDDALADALSRIDNVIKEGRPVQALAIRARLLSQFPRLSSSEGLRTRIRDALVRERELSLRTEPDQEAAAAERWGEASAVATSWGAPHASRMLLRQTRARSDLAPGPEVVVFPVGDSVAACDTLTGTPRWRRVVGAGSPFPPLPVAGQVPSLLLFDTRSDELLLVEERSGKLIWRQAAGGRVRGTPLVHDGQLYAATEGNALLQIDQISGRIRAKLAFTQPVSPPVVLSNGNRIVVVGHESVLYVLTVRPLACEAVVETGHGPGSLEAPLLRMANLVLMAFNDRAESSELQVWKDRAAAGRRAEGAPLERAASVRVPGPLRDGAVLRGQLLFVPVGRERVWAFNVSAQEGEQTLTKLAEFAAEKGQEVPTYLTAGPDDELWMAGAEFRRLKLSTDTFTVLPGTQTIGIPTAPPHPFREDLLLRTQERHSRAAQLTSINRREMTGAWQVVGGGEFRTVVPTEEGGGPALVVLGSGDLFAVASDAVSSGGFDVRPVLTAQPPRGTESPLWADRLADGRAAVWHGGDAPRLWLVSPPGRTDDDIKLPAALQCAPCVADGLLLLPVSGRILVQRLKGASGPPVDEFLLPTQPESAPPAWSRVVAVGPGQVVAGTVDGTVRRLQFRTEPRPHLFELSSIELGEPLNAAWAVSSGRIAIPLAGRTVVLDGLSLERLFEAATPVPAQVWGDESRFFVAWRTAGEGGAGATDLVVIDAAADPVAETWRFRLAGAPLAGAPLHRTANVLAAATDGTLFVLNPASGNIEKTAFLGQRLATGPFLVQGQPMVGTLDGSVLPLAPALESAP